MKRPSATTREGRLLCRWPNWLWPAWWQYVLSKPSRYSTRWESLACRARDHRCGPVFYNPGGLEPDWRCKDCGDYLA